MHFSKNEFLAELQRVEWVRKEINKKLNLLQHELGDIKVDIVDIRKKFWEDVTVNLDTLEEAVETYASIKQQAELLSERERRHQHASKQLKSLTRLHDSPYFGRIDFSEDGTDQLEPIYIGIASFLDEKGETFYVYDWRAPISSLYYDYGRGDASYVTPSGTINGRIDLKRQFIIRKGKIDSMFDTGITIGDGLLQEVLGKQADTQMKSIVATIQKEQNQIIRNEHARVLLVQGAAGSGKTSAALQRVAYLLYRYRESLQADNILLFSPNPMFNSYVSTVLPELGEENMQQATFQEYLEHRLSDDIEIEDPADQMEYILSAPDVPEYGARIIGIQYKATLDFMQQLDQYVRDLEHDGMVFKDLTIEDEIIIAGSAIKEKFYSIPSSSVPNRLTLVKEWLLKELKKKARLERTKPWVEEEIQLLDKEDYLKAFQKLSKRKLQQDDSFDDYLQEEEYLATMVVNRRFKHLKKIILQLQFIDLVAIYKQLFANPILLPRQVPNYEEEQAWQLMCQWTVEQFDQARLAYEDATPLLYMKERIEGYRINTKVRHVFIDEAQDYSPFQLLFLKRLFPKSKMTMLGDIHQAIYAHSTQHSNYDTINTIFESHPEKIVLSRSYRSTRQIVEFTKDILDQEYRIEPFNRHGALPTIEISSSLHELVSRMFKRIQDLSEAGHQTIAVICKTAKECEEAYNHLAQHLSVKLLGKNSASFEPGILIVPAYLAKGVEFDAVLIYNASEQQYHQESERKLFYTACTRAMHELHLFSLGPITPFLSAISSDKYEITRE